VRSAGTSAGGDLITPAPLGTLATIAAAIPRTDYVLPHTEQVVSSTRADLTTVMSIPSAAHFTTSGG
jgi:hypothetical protein